jgi:D-ribulokinase
MGEMALGIDVGSSGVRVTAVGSDGRRAAFAAVPMATAREEGTSFVQDPMTWWNAARQALQMLRHQIDFARIGALAVDGTSGTLVGVDAGGRPITPGLMFNSPAQDEIVGAIAAVASRETAAHGRTSALARAITVQHAPGVCSCVASS